MATTPLRVKEINEAGELNNSSDLNTKSLCLSSLKIIPKFSKFFKIFYSDYYCIIKIYQDK